MNIPIIIICGVVLVAAVFAERKFGIPLGVVCMASAFAISYGAFGMTANKVISAFFPTSIVLSLLLAMAFFAAFTTNGTMQVIGKSLLGLIHGNMKLYPWILFVLCSMLYTVFDSGALRYIITPLIFSVARVGGGSVLMSLSTAFLSFIAGSLNPFIGMDATTRNGILADMNMENGSGINTAVWIGCLVLIVLLHLFVYLITCSWKVPNIPSEGKQDREALSSEQKKSLIILGISVVAFVLPPVLKLVFPSKVTESFFLLFSNYEVFLCGILLVIIFRLSDWRNLLSKVSLRPIIMVVGVAFLLKTAEQAGLMQLCAQVATTVPEWLIPPVLLLIGALLSFFVSASAIQPMLYPMAAAMASTPEAAIIYLTCVTMGAAASGISPISGTGVAFLSTVDRSCHDEYSKKMFFMAALAPVVTAVLCALGLLNPIARAFSSWYY